MTFSFVLMMCTHSSPRQGRNGNAGKGREGFNELFIFSENDLAKGFLRNLCPHRSLPFSFVAVVSIDFDYQKNRGNVRFLPLGREGRG
jgi:hypothetical protein